MSATQERVFKNLTTDRLISSATSSVILSDDGTDQTLTGNLGDLNLVAANYFTFDAQGDSAAASSAYLFKPTDTWALEAASSAELFGIRDGDDTSLFSIHLVSAVNDKLGIEIGGNNTSGDGIMNVTGVQTLNLGINFVPTFDGAGAIVGGELGVVSPSFNDIKKGSSATWDKGWGILVTSDSTVANLSTGDSLAGFVSRLTLPKGTNVDLAAVSGFWSKESANQLGRGVAADLTNFYHFRADNAAGTNNIIDNAYGLHVTEQTRGGTINNGAFFATATAGYKCIVLRDQDIFISSDADGDMDLNADTSIDLNINGVETFAITDDTMTLRYDGTENANWLISSTGNLLLTMTGDQYDVLGDFIATGKTAGGHKFLSAAAKGLKISPGTVTTISVESGDLGKQISFANDCAFGLVEINGDLDHDGTNVGFYGTTPVAQAAAITKPSGGGTIDAEARTAIDSIIDAIGATSGVGITA